MINHTRSSSTKEIKHIVLKVSNPILQHVFYCNFVVSIHSLYVCILFCYFYSAAYIS